MDALTWASKTVPIEKLIPADYNPRKLSQDSETQLDRSIKKFSLADPIVINADHKVIGGHQRLKILKKSGVKTVDVRVPSRLLSESEEKELNLRLNKNLGEWDFDALSKFDEDMLKEVGFNPDELDHIFKVETLPEADDVPDARPTTDIKPGDLFQLGEHRLLCGDSTKVEDVARLMGGEKADMVFTSPPYNVGIKYESHNDKMEDSKYWQLIDGVIKHCFGVLNDGRLIAWNVGVSPKSKPFYHFSVLEIAGFVFYRNIVWKKTGAQIPLFHNSQKDPRARNYKPNYNHELIFLCSKGDVQFGGQTSMPDELQMDVWDISQFSAGGKGHPAAFPVNLAALAIQSMTAKNEVLFEPFGGSGSTLIACEQTSRKCRMIEIDPIYCQVIIDRWEGISGKTAKRI